MHEKTQKQLQQIAEAELVLSDYEEENATVLKRYHELTSKVQAEFNQLDYCSRCGNSFHKDDLHTVGSENGWCDHQYCSIECFVTDAVDWRTEYTIWIDGVVWISAPPVNTTIPVTVASLRYYEERIKSGMRLEFVSLTRS